MKIEAEIRAYLEDFRKKEVELNQLVNNAKDEERPGKNCSNHACIFSVKERLWNGC